MNDKRIRYFALIVLASLCTLVLFLAAPVFGNGYGSGQSQTWPSRTPTATGPGPTQNPPATAINPGQTPATTAQPSQTPGASEETPVSGSSPGAATVPPAGVAPVESPGPEDILPTETSSVRLSRVTEVGDCGFPPLVLALGLINVRSGPGIEYEVIATLAYQDERPILGRAAAAPWWLIQLSAEQQAWVSDLAVSVAGYTGAVPVIESSNGDNGNQPPWEPTPNPLCTPPALETITAGSAQLMAAFSGATSTPESLESQVLDFEAESGATGLQAPGFSLLEPENVSSGTNLLWLPAVGVFLILAGGIALIVQRRQS